MANIDLHSISDPLSTVNKEIPKWVDKYVEAVVIILLYI